MSTVRLRTLMFGLSSLVLFLTVSSCMDVLTDRTDDTVRTDDIVRTNDTIRTNDAVKTYVVTSTDDREADYLTAAPFAAWMWSSFRRKTILPNVVPVTLLCDRNRRPNATRLVREFVEGIVVDFCLAEEEEDASTMQVGRLAAFALPFVRPEDVLVIFDVDAWPMNVEFWNDAIRSIENDTYDFYVYNGPFHASQTMKNDSDRFAMSGLIAKSKTWRSMWTSMGDPSSTSSSRRNDDTIEIVTRNMLDLGRRTKPDWKTNRWSWDQVLVGRMLVERCPSARCRINPIVKRLDRSHWIVGEDVAKYTDAHVVRGFVRSDRWFKVRPTLESALGRNFVRSVLDSCRSQLFDATT